LWSVYADDEALGTMARMAATGHAVHVLILADGVADFVGGMRLTLTLGHLYKEPM
jgi:hypothetical protein